MGPTHAEQRWGTSRRETASPRPLLAECLGKDHRCVYHWLPHSCCEETRLNLTTGSGACWQLVWGKEEAGEVREGCVSQGAEVVAGPTGDPGQPADSSGRINTAGASCPRQVSSWGPSPGQGQVHPVDMGCRTEEVGAPSLAGWAFRPLIVSCNSVVCGLKSE